MADYGIRRYRLREAMLSRGLRDGFTLDGGTLETAERGYIVLPALDSSQPDCGWGRLSLDCRLGPEGMLTIRAFASNQNAVVRNNEAVSIDRFLLDPEVSRQEKERLFLLADGLEHSGAKDVLLMEQTGRYLWLWLEVTGGGRLENLRVYVPGDNFFRTFPQVYQMDNEFLRRYLSIFSTMYQELQEEIDGIPDLLDADTAPEPLLPVFAFWLGLETDMALFEAAELRRLLKAAPELLARKGTKWAVLEAVKLLTEEPVYLVERNLLPPGADSGGALYGETPYDFTVMLASHLDEKLRLRLKYLIDQFKPARSRYQIVFLEECGGLDAFTYLDLNGRMLQNVPGSLDEGQGLTGTAYLR